MQLVVRNHWIFILVLIGLCIFFVWGVSRVPFHPDESTLIFMSGDLERIISNPLDLSWTDSEPITDLVRYRLIDAPLTRYLLGFGRMFTGLPAPPVDWDWTSSWEENQIAGALPAKEVLWVERLVIVSLFPLTLILLYLIGLKLNGKLLGSLVVLIFGLHPLILLHTRRAMAEGILIFGLVLCLYAFLTLEHFPLLIGFAVAIAFNAKHSAIVLLPIGLIVVNWQIRSTDFCFSHLVSRSIKYLFGFFLLTLIMNPILWRNPIEASLEAIKQRQNLVSQQVQDMYLLSPDQVMETRTDRAAVLIAQLFIAPPIFSEAGNYRQETFTAEKEYLNTFGNVIGRNFLVGGIFLGVFLLGIINLCRRIFSSTRAERRISILLLLSTSALMVGYIFLIPLAWQRYAVPLIPFTTILVGMGIVWGIENSRRIFSHGSLSSRLSEILAQFSTYSRMS